MLKIKKPLFQWGPVEAAVQPIIIPGEANVNHCLKEFAYAWPRSLFIFQDGFGTYLDSLDELTEESRQFTKIHVLNKRRIFERKLRLSKNNLLKIHKQIETINLKNFREENLLKLYEKFIKIYYYFWAIWAPIELVNFGLEEKLKKEINKMIKDKNTLNNILASLVTTSKPTFYREENQDMLKLSLLPENKQNSALEKHTKKYFWVLNNYKETKILNKDYFKKELEFIKRNFSSYEIRKKIKEIYSYSNTITKERKRLIKQYKISPSVNKYINYLDHYIYMQDLRKRYTLMADQTLDVLLKEMGRLYKIRLNEIKCLTPYETVELLENKEFNYKEIIKRRKKPVIFDCQQNKMVEYFGTQAKNIIKEYLGHKIERKIQVLEGILVSSGAIRYFRGPVKVVKSPSETKKVKPGDILVTAMTSPDFIVAMKKAGAIITDEGGLTCHAAVVSRELGKCCIVGTKLATKVLKDGQIVELHTRKGTIKIFSF